MSKCDVEMEKVGDASAVGKVDEFLLGWFVVVCLTYQSGDDALELIGEVHVQSVDL